MKILEWMHQKLHPAADYSRVSHSKATAIERDAADLINTAHWPPSVLGTELDAETPLLFHVNLAGILTIGTLGYSHPPFPPHLSEEPTLEWPENEIPAAAKPPAQITQLLPATELFMIKTDHSVIEVHVSEEKIMAEPLLKEDRERKKRTTLADLFAADQPPKTAGRTKSVLASDLKSGGKEKKKKVKRNKKGDDELESSQSQSLAAAGGIHRMMTWMVKKKIHPVAATTGRNGGGTADVAADLHPFSGGGGGGGGHVA